MKTLSAPQPTFLGALRNIGAGIYRATARFAGYSAASSTTTTRTGSRVGLNQNTSLASIQRLGMSFTADMVAKDNPLCAAYLALRQNYCSSTLQYLPATPDEGLNGAITEYLHGSDGCGGVLSTMGVDCSMQDAFMRTADLECPVKGDSAMILWRSNPDDELRLLEVSADQIGELYNFTTERRCSLTRDADGRIRECAGSDCVYFAGRYFRGADCVAYKIYPRSDQWYGTPTIYDASDVLYFRDPASFRGVRGITLFHAALPYMQKSDDLLSAALGIAQRQARDAYFISNNSGGPPDEPDQEVADSTTGRITHYETIPEGPQERYRYNGDTITPNTPTAPGTDVIDGVSAAAQMVALALRVTYGFLVEGSKLGGVTSRGDTQKNWKEFSRIQRMIHRPNLNRIKDVKLLDAHRRGLLTIPHGMTTAQFLRGRWMLPTSPVTDAFNDAKENVDMVREGLESPQDIIAETNRDWRDVIRKSGEWREAVEREAAARTKALKADGIPAVISGQEISATSDNPMQAAQADAQGQPAPGAEKPAGEAPANATAPATAAMSAEGGELAMMRDLLKKNYAVALFDKDTGDHWVTTEGGNHVMIGKDGEIKAGNPHVVKAMQGHKERQSKTKEILSHKTLSDAEKLQHLRKLHGIEDEPAAPAEKEKDAPKAGASWEAVTPTTGTKTRGKYHLIESHELVTSDKSEYDQSLQPRDRGRQASKEQIASIAASHQAQRTGDAATTDLGAPIVNDKNHVLSGNGRTMARRVLPEGKESDYRHYLMENADKFGISKEQIQSMKQPTLVRKIEDYGGLTPQTLAEESNKSQVLGMSTAEKASSDARLLHSTPGLLDSFQPSEDGDILAASNRPFLNAFIKASGSAAELTHGSGYNNAELSKRVKNAVLASVLGPENRELITSLTERAEELGVARVASGVMSVAPGLAKLQGTPHDISPMLSKAMTDLVRIRTSGEKVHDFLSQENLFGDPQRTAASDMLLMQLAEAKSAKAVAEPLAKYCQLAKNQDTTTDDMFGGGITPPAELLNFAMKPV